MISLLTLCVGPTLLPEAHRGLGAQESPGEILEDRAGEQDLLEPDRR